jgi:hypothetical protein
MDLGALGEAIHQPKPFEAFEIFQTLSELRQYLNSALDSYGKNRLDWHSRRFIEG